MRSRIAIALALIFALFAAAVIGATAAQAMIPAQAAAAAPSADCGGGGCGDLPDHDDMSDLSCFAHCAAMAFLPETVPWAALPKANGPGQSFPGSFVDHGPPPDPHPPRSSS